MIELLLAGLLLIGGFMLGVNIISAIAIAALLALNFLVDWGMYSD